MTEHLSMLADLVQRGITRTDPRVGDVGGNTIFTGSFDWHSCVHAHWALLEIARMTGTDGQFVRSRLTRSNVAAEIDSVKSDLDFEKPYGRAWLLLLLETLQSPELDEFASWLWHDLHDWLRSSPFPESDNGFIGTHKSWLFCYFLLALAEKKRPGTPIDLTQLGHDRIDPVRDQIVDKAQTGDIDRRDFIHLPSLLTTVDCIRNRPPDERLVNIMQRDRDDLLSQNITITERSQCHEPGRYIMQSWPFAFIDPPSAHAIVDRVLADESCWKDSFEWVSHWVPQFVVMTAVCRAIA